MSRPSLEVADIVRAHAGAFLRKYGGAVSSAKRRVLRKIASCRTAQLGGHVERCNRCGHEEISYNSCRNRHCPKCQAAAKAEWLEAREADLLLHVIDASDPYHNERQHDVEDVLESIGVEGIPVIRVLNKIDRCGQRAQVHRGENGLPLSVSISALTGEGLDDG